MLRLRLAPHCLQRVDRLAHQIPGLFLDPRTVLDERGLSTATEVKTAGQINIVKFHIDSHVVFNHSVSETHWIR